MKVLFLDIDGVLNSQRSCIAFGGYPHEVHGKDRQQFDEVALHLIRGIVKLADASVVLSSSWRITHGWDLIGRELDLPIMGATPTKWEPNYVRGHEIKEWLDAHPEVESYVIVDDNSDMLPEQMDRFVQTCGFDGFRWMDAERMAELFGVSLYDVNRPPKTPSLGWEAA
jgi:hypothetical protein